MTVMEVFFYLVLPVAFVCVGWLAVRLHERSTARAHKIAVMQRLVDEGLGSGLGDRSPEGLFDDAAARKKQALD